MSEIITLDGPVPAWFRIESTAHGLQCVACSSACRGAAVYVRIGGSTTGSYEQRDADGLAHFATVTRLS